MNSLDRFSQSAAEDAQRSIALNKWDDACMAKLQEADELAKKLAKVLTEACELNHVAEEALMSVENVTAGITCAMQELGE